MEHTGLSGRSVLVTGGSGFIGTNLIEKLLREDMSVTNVDIREPLNRAHNPHWIDCDVMNSVELAQAFSGAKPEFIVHLAARTDCVESTTVEAGYLVNTEGTANVLRAAADVGTVERFIHTSSQYVCGPRFTPKHDRDFGPHTVYGESKAQSEEIVRSLNPRFHWTIVRPVNIWGPYHERYRREVWRVIERGLYMHPGRAPVVRTYGYVGNVIWQIARILSISPDLVHSRVLYVGDHPDDIYHWVDEFSRQLRGRGARVVPRRVVRAIARCGDLARGIGVAPPLDSSRFASMTSDYRTPTAETHQLLGPSPYSLHEGVAETVAWLRGVTQMKNRVHSTGLDAKSRRATASMHRSLADG